MCVKREVGRSGTRGAITWNQQGSGPRYGRPGARYSFVLEQLAYPNSGVTTLTQLVPSRPPEAHGGAHPLRAMQRPPETCYKWIARKPSAASHVPSSAPFDQALD